jgi:hypothetical protein
MAYAHSAGRSPSDAPIQPPMSGPNQKPMRWLAW